MKNISGPNTTKFYKYILYHLCQALFVPFMREMHFFNFWIHACKLFCLFWIWIVNDVINKKKWVIWIWVFFLDICDLLCSGIYLYNFFSPTDLCNAYFSFVFFYTIYFILSTIFSCFYRVKNFCICYAIFYF